MLEKCKLLLIILLTTILFGCSQMNQYSPEKVISNALAGENEISYYGEMTFTMDGIEEFEDMKLKEWRQNDKSRVEVEVDDQLIVTVGDNESIIVYQEKEKKAVKIKNKEFEDFYMNPKEQVEFLLQSIRDTHYIETAGEEKVANRDAFHLIAKTKTDKKSMIGDQEFWIDKEHWMVLKMKTTTGDFQGNMEYTKIDYNYKIDDSLFQIDLPEDVVIEEFDDFDEGYAEEEITLKDIPDRMGQNILYIPDSDAHKVETITFTAIEGEHGYTDVTIDYKRSDGLPFLTLTIISTEENDDEEDIDVFGTGADKVDIRNKQGEFIDFTELRMVSWSEGGLRYSIELIDETIKLDDVIELTEKMEEI